MGLKRPCPFCGSSEVTARHIATIIIITCDNCGAAGPSYTWDHPETEEEMWNKWNSRSYIPEGE